MPPDRHERLDPNGSAVSAEKPGPSLARAVVLRVRDARLIRHPDRAPDPGTRAFSSRTIRIVAALLLSIPVTTALVALALTSQELAATARLYPAAAPGLVRQATMGRAAAARPAVAAAMEGRTVSDILARIGRALPVEAKLVSVARATDGTVRMEVETIDPEALRRALAGDPLLERLRSVGESTMADRGIRVSLAGTLPR